jgi:predicted nucleic acid-binding protein
LVASDAVLAEAQVGDEEAVRSRLAFLNTLEILTIHPLAENLAAHLLKQKAVPAKAFTDAVHIAIAALHEVQFIASWNFRHIVGAVARRRIETALTDAKAFVPIIATPEEISESLR